MKYKIIKKFPNPNKEYQVGEIITKNGYRGVWEIAENWPEFFEEVKDKLFTTEDGLDIYKGDNCFAVNRTTYSAQYGEYYGDSPEALVYFANMPNAEKWIDENKPMYSKKQIKDALKKISNYYSDSFIIDLMKELKIN